MTTAQIGTMPGLVTPERLTPDDAMLIAQLEKRGHHVQRLQKNGYLASQWGMSLHLQDVDALAAFAKRVGAA